MSRGEPDKVFYHLVRDNHTHRYFPWVKLEEMLSDDDIFVFDTYDEAKAVADEFNSCSEEQMKQNELEAIMFGDLKETKWKKLNTHT